MKRLILLSVSLFFFTFLSFSQKAPFTTFNKTVKLCDTCSGYQQEITGVVETNEGLMVYGNAFNHYTVLGNIYNTNLSFDTIYWKHILGSDTVSYHLSKMIRLKNKSGYLLAGIYGIPDSIGFFHRSFLMKLDTSGTILWQKQYVSDEDPDSQSTLYDVVESLDNGYLLTMYSNTKGIIIKTDSNGVKQWQAVTGQPSTTTYLRSCITTVDSGFLIGGSISNGIYYGEALVFKYSKDGDYEWVKSFGGPYVDYGTVLTRGNNGDTYYGSYLYTTKVVGWGYFDAGEMRLFEIDGDGNVLFEKRIGDTSSRLSPESIHQFDNSNLVVTGTSVYLDTAWMYFLSPDGDSVWFEPFLSKLDSVSNYGFLSSSIINGGVVGCGMADNYWGNFDRRGWLVKTDMYGCMNNISILLQPLDVVAKIHNNVRLEISAYSVDSISYQWYKDTTMIEGATDSVLVLENFLPPDEGFYFCHLTNSCETIKSDTIKVFTHLGVDQHRTGSLLSVFPNPAGSFVILKSGAFFRGEVEVSIIELNGKIVRKVSLSGFEAGEQIKMDVSGLPSGTYIINVKSSKLTDNTLFVKSQ